jgi:hypothetical protein
MANISFEEMAKYFCGFRFAFDLPESHPWFTDWDAVPIGKTIGKDLVLEAIDGAGAKTAIVFEYTGDMKQVYEAVRKAIHFLKDA